RTGCCCLKLQIWPQNPKELFIFLMTLPKRRGERLGVFLDYFERNDSCASLFPRMAYGVSEVFENQKFLPKCHNSGHKQIALPDLLFSFLGWIMVGCAR